MSDRISELKQDAIVDWVKPGSSVLDLGCGNGGLLARLVSDKEVRAQGIDVDDGFIQQCVRKGLNALHEPIDDALLDYGDNAFDYAVFNDSLQRAAKKPDTVLREALRVSDKVIVVFSNFAHYRARWQILARGRTPVTRSLPYEWYDTPNLHFLSITDFVAYCHSNGIAIEGSSFFGERGAIRALPNLRALTSIFLITSAENVRSTGGEDA